MHLSGGGFAVENPEPWLDGSASLFFLLDDFVGMGALVADFGQRRFSGAATKPTRILFSGGGFSALHRLRCNHAHLLLGS